MFSPLVSLFNCLSLSLSVCTSVTISNWCSWNFTTWSSSPKARSLLFLRSKGQHREHRVNNFVKFLKSSIFISLTWNLKRICISGHLIQQPIIFEVKFVLWISQVLCDAQHLSCLLFCEQNISNSCWPIQTELGGQVGYLTRNNWFDFGEDLNPDPTIF